MEKEYRIDTFKYYPSMVCATEMDIILENNIIKDIKIINGCDGNSTGLISLCRNQEIDTIIEKLSGITCLSRRTSCPDQLAQALIKYKEESKV